MTVDLSGSGRTCSNCLCRRSSTAFVLSITGLLLYVWRSILEGHVSLFIETYSYFTGMLFSSLYHLCFVLTQFIVWISSFCVIVAICRLIDTIVRIISTIGDLLELCLCLHIMYWLRYQFSPLYVLFLSGFALALWSPLLLYSAYSCDCIAVVAYFLLLTFIKRTARVPAIQGWHGFTGGLKARCETIRNEGDDFFQTKN